MKKITRTTRCTDQIQTNGLTGEIAEVCLRCGERFYPQETIQHFEEIRRKLELKDTEGFEAIGQLFHVRI